MRRISIAFLVVAMGALMLTPIACVGGSYRGGYYRGHYGSGPWYGYRDRYIVVDRPPCVDCDIDPDEPIAVPMPEPGYAEPMPMDMDMDIPDIPMDMGMDMPMDF
ncbi:MAG: hypothetical protein JRG96_09630 [Deltaproteobacteria bacterium]|nr:hypothetical protein [Deltaproteobacteria bacterium]MBW2417882.1 hypothetical protein [Deltaproteobacteria bacterium]